MEKELAMVENTDDYIGILKAEHEGSPEELEQILADIQAVEEDEAARMEARFAAACSEADPGKKT